MANMEGDSTDPSQPQTQQPSADETLRYRLLVETIQSAIIETDDQGRIVFCNPAARRLIGDERMCQAGLSLWQLMPAPAGLGSETSKLPIDQAPEPQPYTVQFSNSDQSVVDLRVEWNFRRDSSGRPLGYIVVLNDVTAILQTEQRLRRYAERLEEMVESRTQQLMESERERQVNEKLAATGRLAASIAHEVNNPLAGIKNSFLLLKTAIAPDHPYYSYVGRIEREIDRIRQIMRQMFDLYRPQKEQPHRFLVGEIIQDVVAILQAGRAGEETIAAKLPAEPIELVLPENALRQVLFNILQNAIEASPANSPIEVSVVAGDQIVIAVTDHGSGIPEEMRSRVFEPFFTTKSGTQKVGLGLGLSVCKGLVEAMGGTIDFQSRLGRGTVFYVSLPRTMESPQPA